MVVRSKKTAKKPKRAVRPMTHEEIITMALRARDRASDLAATLEKIGVILSDDADFEVYMAITSAFSCGVMNGIEFAASTFREKKGGRRGDERRNGKGS